MTENEAIQFLDNIKHEEAGRAIGKDGFYAELMGYHVEALNMAIKALETIPKYKDAYNKGWDDGAKATYEHLKMCKEEQEPCNDAISRQAVLDLLFNAYIKTELTSIGYASKEYAELCVDELNELPTVNPQYTDDEIQKIQDLEQAEIQKAYELGKPETGHWIDTDEWRETVDGFEQWGYFRKCSKCGYVFKFLEIDNYCPNCGCRMVGPQESEG